MPPAKTGKLNTNRNAVTQTLTKNRGMLNHLNEGLFKLFIVHKKLIEPAMLLTPAKCKLKITMSTLLFLCPIRLLKGG